MTATPLRLVHRATPLRLVHQATPLRLVHQATPLRLIVVVEILSSCAQVLTQKQKLLLEVG